MPLQYIQRRPTWSELGHSRGFLWKVPLRCRYFRVVFYELYFLGSKKSSYWMGGGGEGAACSNSTPSVSVSKQNTNKTINFWHCKRQIFLFHCQTALHKYVYVCPFIQFTTLLQKEQPIGNIVNFCHPMKTFVRTYYWEHWMTDLLVCTDMSILWNRTR
jgi:hypothetical protein